MGVLAADDLVDEEAIASEIAEVAGAAHQQRILHCLLEMAVWTFDRPILMRDTTIVAGRLHAVMEAQRVIAPGQILARVAVEVAERRREAVAAMLVRRTAQGPQRILQSFRQRHIAFAAENDMACAKPE